MASANRSDRPSPHDLAALLHDQRSRWRRGDRVRVEVYLERAPSLRDDPEGLVDLIYQEVVLRQERGETPGLDEYVRRFPDLAAMLRLQFEVDPLFAPGEWGDRPTDPDRTRTAPGSAAEASTLDAPEPPQLDPPEPPHPDFVAVPSIPDTGELAIGQVLPPGFEILSFLGGGGMGKVYRALDRSTKTVVALKTMKQAGPAALYRFKQEFRSLAGIVHPNLVQLHDLVSDGRGWFFTMELIEGNDFLSYVRTGPRRRPESTAPVRRDEIRPTELPPTELPPTDQATAADLDTRADTRPAGDDPPPTEPATDRPTEPAPIDIPTRLSDLEDVARGDLFEPVTTAVRSPDVEQRNRLRLALRQLAEGVHALHQAGVVHRDIKPGNVVVAHDGRVVLLDFGLAAELDVTGAHQTTDQNLAGTVAYMSPEQAAGEKIDSSADWYCVGVMLYECLTGRLPFLGGILEILMDKQRFEPPPPRELVPGVPEDLGALCVDLLRRDPKARPSGRDVLRRLGSASASNPSSLAPLTTAGQGSILIGRERHRRVLDGAFTSLERGRTVLLDVHGRSGVGKSALVRSFLDDLQRDDKVVVLEGRCYERESVPYKALDSLIDALSRHLRRLPTLEAQALLPRDVGPLARVFPVLRRVEAVSAVPRRVAEIPDPQELRRRAFAALRELLARLGDHRRLVLMIDDLQWGDVDSAALLAELVRPPDPPVLLLLSSYRSEDRATSPCLAALRASRPSGPMIEPLELEVGALAESEARELAKTLLGADHPSASGQAGSIARESGGNPFFVAELVRYVQAGAGPMDRLEEPGATAITLDEVLRSRIAQLPQAARRLLEVVSVSGRPIPPDDACRAAGVTSDERSSLNLLRSGRLIRSTRQADREAIETYHDRVRETVVAHLPPDDLRDHHRRLALALEASGHSDAETLGVHFREAGEPERAADHFAQAAALAAEALAFDRAATLYRLALDLRPDGGEAIGIGSGPEVRALRVRLGDALANAGRGAEAAKVYLAAAGGANLAEARDLRGRAAMQFLISGHIDEGLEALHQVLAAVGMTLPATPGRALASLLLRRLRLRLTGFRFAPRDTSEVSPADRTRLDVCWSAAVGLSVVDWIRGADFQARHLQLALAVGEPFPIARALAMEAAHVATGGGKARKRTEAVLKLADEQAKRVDHPHALGLVDLAHGVSAYLEGRWRPALEWSDRAEATFRDRCTGVAWEIDTTHVFSLCALTHLGEVAELSRRWPVLLGQAQERGDLYSVMNLSTYPMSFVRLAEDEPEAARDLVRAMMARWSRGGYHVQHNDQLWAACQIELYRGDGASAWDLITSNWPRLSRSLLLRVQFLQLSMLLLRARCALAMSLETADPGPLLRAASAVARRVARERMPWSDPAVDLIRATIDAARGHSAAAEGRLESAIRGFEAAEMALVAASARRRLGELRGGDAGRALVAEADAFMLAQGITAPGRMAGVFAPGFRDSPRTSS